MIVAVIVVAICFVAVLSRWDRNSLPYPPGPPPDPIIGNVRDMMNDNQEQEFQRWGARYGTCNYSFYLSKLLIGFRLGDVSYIRIFSQPLVVINSFLAAKDLLEKRGAIYSGRPRFVLIAEL